MSNNTTTSIQTKYDYEDTYKYVLQSLSDDTDSEDKPIIKQTENDNDYCTPQVFSGQNIHAFNCNVK